MPSSAIIETRNYWTLERGLQRSKELSSPGTSEFQEEPFKVENDEL
jgi:hypothetical protein